jgi:integrase
MTIRYRLIRRRGVFYSIDRRTFKKESLRTADRGEAEQLLAAKNQAAVQPSLNRSMAKVYLSAASPELATRTWADVMEHYVKAGVPSTRDRKERAFRSRPFAALRNLKLIDTEPIHFLFAAEHKRSGASTVHYLARLQNFALNLGWLLAPVLAPAAWPKFKKTHFTAITAEEHARIVAREGNPERRHFYELLWETGGSQSDIAALSWNEIDLGEGVIRFRRKKLSSRGGGDSLLRIGPRIRAILDQLPQEGDLFPVIRREQAKHRSTEFHRRCRTLGIEGRNLHGYRYAWAQRAKAAGVPLREAMVHLGHKSRAVHESYAGGAEAAVLPLEFYEAEKARKIIRFEQAMAGEQDPRPADGDEPLRRQIL